jgi:hypothetical protein
MKPRSQSIWTESPAKEGFFFSNFEFGLTSAGHARLTHRPSERLHRVEGSRQSEFVVQPRFSFMCKKSAKQHTYKKSKIHTLIKKLIPFPAHFVVKIALPYFLILWTANKWFFTLLHFLEIQQTISLTLICCSFIFNGSGCLTIFKLSVTIG